MTTTARIYSLAAVASVAVAALSGCASDAGTTGTDAAPTFTPVSTVAVADSEVELPDDAVEAATRAAGQCDGVTPELVVGKIAATSGYDLNYSADDGGAGYSGMYPEKWKDYGSGDLDSRGDLDAATDATAKELCDAYATAQGLSEDHPETTVEDLALSISLVGERYTSEYGVPDAGDQWDPHTLRADVDAITAASASVTTTDGESNA